MAIEVSTNEYEFSHGHKPRGRGSWAFEIGPGSGVTFISDGVTYSMTYGDAKRIAVRMAKEKGVRCIVACP